MQSIPRSKHTLNKSKQFYFQKQVKKFSKVILPHAFLVIAKSHCAYTIVLAKRMHVVYEIFARSISVSLYEE